MVKWGFRAVIALAAVLSLVFGGTVGAYGESKPAGTAEVYRIAVLGDSLAAGYEPGLTEKSVPYGYAERVYEQALFHGRANVDNYGIIGLGTEGLIKLLQGVQNGTVLKAADFQDFSTYEESARLTLLADGIGARSAQMKSSLAGANLVIITIGANDFGDFLKRVLGQTKADATTSLDGEFLALVDKYKENAEQAIRQTAALAPKARILFSDQYLPLPKLFKPDLYDLMYEKAVAPLTAAVDAVSAKLQGEGLKVDAVHIADRFKGQEGALTHMSVSFIGEATKPDIHPTQDGYKEMAQAFSEAVWKEYRKPVVRPAGVAISMILAGKDWQQTGVNKPVVKNEIAYTAADTIAKALGAEFKWTAKTKTAVFKKKGVAITFVAGSKTATVNGGKLKLDNPAFLQKAGKENKLFVPLAFLASKLKYDVVYRSTLQSYFINP